MKNRPINIWLASCIIANPVAYINSPSEIAFVGLGSTLLAGFTLSWIGVTSENLYLFPMDGGGPDFLAATRSALLMLSIEGVYMLGAGYALGWWRIKKPIAAYGLTKGKLSILALIGIGVALGLVSTIPGQILDMREGHYGVGRGTPYQELIARVPWNIEFWIFNAAASIVAVPIIEEIICRGYVQTRLAESLIPIGAILVSSLFFMMIHFRFLSANFWRIAIFLTDCLSVICCAYVFYRTGFLFPDMIAHGMLNCPHFELMAVIILFFSLLAMTVFRRKIYIYSAKFCNLWKQRDGIINIAAGFGFVLFLMLTYLLISWISSIWLGALLAAFAVTLPTIKRIYLAPYQQHVSSGGFQL